MRVEKQFPPSSYRHQPRKCTDAILCTNSGNLKYSYCVRLDVQTVEKSADLDSDCKEPTGFTFPPNLSRYVILNYTIAELLEDSDWQDCPKYELFSCRLTD